MLQDIKCQFKRSNTMPAGTGGLEIVCSIAAKGQQFIILCPVQLVDIQTKGRPVYPDAGTRLSEKSER